MASLHIVRVEDADLESANGRFNDVASRGDLLQLPFQRALEVSPTRSLSLSGRALME